MPTLPEFIASFGDDKEAGRVLGITERAAECYRLCQRTPRPAQAAKIISRSKNHPAGPVEWEDIYSPHKPVFKAR